MKYPLYDGFQVGHARQHGNDEVADFASFLDDLLKANMLEGVQLGIVKLAADQGTEALSEKQHYHLGQVVDMFNDRCDVCGELIPFSDRLVLHEESNSCSYHARL